MTDTKVEPTLEVLALQMDALHAADVEFQKTIHQLVAAINNSALVIDCLIKALKDHDIEVDLPPHLRKE